MAAAMMPGKMPCAMVAAVNGVSPYGVSAAGMATTGVAAIRMATALPAARNRSDTEQA